MITKFTDALQSNPFGPLMGLLEFHGLLTERFISLPTLFCLYKWKTLPYGWREMGREDRGRWPECDNFAVPRSSPLSLHLPPFKTYPWSLSWYIYNFFFLFLLNGFRIREEFKSAEEYWPLERKLCSALMNKEEVCLSLGSFLSKII